MRFIFLDGKKRRCAEQNVGIGMKTIYSKDWAKMNPIKCQVPRKKGNHTPLTLKHTPQVLRYEILLNRGVYKIKCTQVQL